MKCRTRVLSLLDRLLDYAREDRSLTSLAWKPRSLASLKLNNRLAVAAPGLRTIFDCGANIGQFTRAAAQTFPGAQVFSFEPLERSAQLLARNIADCENVTVIPAAVGDKDGNLTFHSYSDPQLSSALDIAPQFKAVFQGSEPAPTVQVPVLRLDTFVAARRFQRPLLLKLDLQGYELKALQGASEFLKQTDFVLTETALQQMYVGESLFQDIVTHMTAAGFRFQEPLAFLEGADGRIFQMDVLFSRAK